jgi:serine/threonine protein kinase
MDRLDATARVRGGDAYATRWSSQADVTPTPAYPFLAAPAAQGEMGRLGNYRVLELLGAGGMGMVFRGEDSTLCRPVALKVMKPDVQDEGGSSCQRFLREARAMAAIKNDHLVTVYQVGEENGTIYLAMELLEGETLERWLQRSGPPDLAEARRIGREIALGLTALHRRGLIHRDIKPSNVWLEAPSGRVKILDFGLARATREDTQLTQSGLVIGTPAYLSPEQARGKTADTRSDLFSLGCVLYLLCTKQRAFPAANTLDQLAAIAADDPKAVRELNPRVPEALDRLVGALLAKNPEDRPASAASVAEQLHKIRRTLTPRKQRPGKDKDSDSTERLPAPSSRTPRSGRRVLRPARKAPVLLIASIVLTVTATGGGIGLWALTRDPSQADTNHPAATKTAAPQASASPQPESAAEFLAKMDKHETVNWPFVKGPSADGFKGKKKGPDPKAPPLEAILNGPITVGGQHSPNGIFMHPPPPHEGVASISYRLGKRYRHLEAQASLNDSSDGSASPLTFSVYGDGKLLWRSPPLLTRADTRTCAVSLEHVDVLKLEVIAEGDIRKAHAVWIEPRVK